LFVPYDGRGNRSEENFGQKAAQDAHAAAYEAFRLAPALRKRIIVQRTSDHA
jgi:hypothetical protein